MRDGAKYATQCCDGLRNDNKRRYGGVTKCWSARILRSFLFSVKANFSRRMSDGAQLSTTPRRKRCQPPGRHLQSPPHPLARINMPRWLELFRLPRGSRRLSNRTSFKRARANEAILSEFRRDPVPPSTSLPMRHDRNVVESRRELSVWRRRGESGHE